MKLLINKTLYLMLLAGLFCLSGVACTSSSVDGTSESADADKAPVAFGSSVTRAAVDAQKTNFQNFGVWGGYEGLHNLFQAETVNPDGTYTGVRYWMDGKTHAFYALHPHPSLWQTDLKAAVTCSVDGTFTVNGFDASVRRGMDAVDLMTAHASGLTHTAGQTAQKVPLKFGHELAWVEFQIQAEQAVSIDYVQLRNVAYKGDVTLTPAMGASSYQATWSNLAVSAVADGVPLAEQTIVIPQEKLNQTIYLLGGHLLLPPQKLTREQVFSMHWTYTGMDSEPRTVNVSMPDAGLAVWEKGKHYVYSAVISPTPVDVAFQVTVKPWKETTVSADL